MVISRRESSHTSVKQWCDTLNFVSNEPLPFLIRSSKLTAAQPQVQPLLAPWQCPADVGRSILTTAVVPKFVKHPSGILEGMTRVWPLSHQKCCLKSRRMRSHTNFGSLWYIYPLFLAGAADGAWNGLSGMQVWFAKIRSWRKGRNHILAVSTWGSGKFWWLVESWRSEIFSYLLYMCILVYRCIYVYLINSHSRLLMITGRYRSDTRRHPLTPVN